MSYLDTIAVQQKDVLRFWCSLKISEDFSLASLPWFNMWPSTSKGERNWTLNIILRTQVVKPWIRKKKPTHRLTQRVCFNCILFCNWCSLYKAIWNCISFLNYFNTSYSVTCSDNQEAQKSQGEKTILFDFSYYSVFSSSVHIFW